MRRFGLSAVALAAIAHGCSPTLEVIERRVTAHDAAEHDRFETEVARVERELGAARFVPPTEDRLLQRAGTRVPYARDPKVELVRDDVDSVAARIGYLELVGGGCVTGWTPPAPQVRFARNDAGVRLILVEPEVERVVHKMPGDCAAPGCGAQPPPPLARIHWLPITDLEQLTVERRRVRVVMETISCDHPIQPP